MENKQNLIIGAMGVMFLWLAYLTYTTFSGVDSDVINQTRALSNNNNYNASTSINTQDPNSAIKPTNAITQPQQPTIKPEDAATMAFSEIKHDFGTITEGEKVEHVFKFKNTSANPLIINNARGSCGCTVPEWPKEPIAPGASSEIRVKFDSKGKKGSNNKQVTIDANTIPGSTVLNILADVVQLDADGNPIEGNAAPVVIPQN